MLAECFSIHFAIQSSRDAVVWPHGTISTSHLSNKRGGGGKIAKSQNVEVGVNVEGGILWKKRMHNSNKRGVEGGKI